MTARSESGGQARTVTRPDLAEHARLELATREVVYPQQVAQGKRDAGEAGRSIAAWRAIVALLRDGTAEFDPCLLAGAVGLDGPAQIKIAWPALVEVAHAAARHRLRKALEAASGWRDGAASQKAADEAALRSSLAREIRDLLTRSAIRQGAKLPSFDERASVGLDGPATKTRKAA